MADLTRHHSDALPIVRPRCNGAVEGATPRKLSLVACFESSFTEGATLCQNEDNGAGRLDRDPCLGTA